MQQTMFSRLKKNSSMLLTYLFGAALLLGLSVHGAFADTNQLAPPAGTKLDSGDTSWMLASTALVLLMTPGLALFYAGMARSKNVLSV